MKQIITTLLLLVCFSVCYSQTDIWANTPFDYQSWTGGGPSTFASEISIVSDSVAWVLFADNDKDPTTIRKVAYTYDGGGTWETVDGPGVTGSGYSNIHAISKKKAWISINSVGSGVYYTEDAGNTWNKVPEIYSSSKSFCNFVYFWDEMAGFAQGDPLTDLGDFEMYLTTDGGVSWNPITGYKAKKANENGTVGFFDVALNGTLYWTTTTGRVFRTDDKAVSFISTETNLANVTVKPGIVVIDEETVIITSYNETTKKFSYKITENGGGNWADWKPFGADETFGTYDFCNVPGTDILISVSPFTEEGGLSPFISYCTDGRSGEEWTRFDQWNYVGASQVLTVNFEIKNNVLIGYATSYNYGATYNGPQGILRYFGNLPPEGVSVHEISNLDLKIYPNPTSDFIYITSKTEIQEVTVYDVSGKIIFDNYTKGSKSVVNFENSTKGFYFLKVKLQDGSVINKKVIVK